MYSNADMHSRHIQTYCRLDLAGEELLRMAMTKLGLSARAYQIIMIVSRTIAELAHSSHIRSEHISEAIHYRTLDRNRGTT